VTTLTSTWYRESGIRKALEADADKTGKPVESV